MSGRPEETQRHLILAKQREREAVRQNLAHSYRNCADCPKHLG